MSLSALRARFSEQTMPVGGETWRYIDTEDGGADGSRPTLVMLPGAQGTEEVFYKQILALSPAARVIAVWYPALSDATALAAGLRALLQGLGAGPVTLLGTSFGGYIAQMFAASYPEQVDRLILANSFVDPAPAQAKGRPLAELQATPAATLLAAMVERLRGQPESELKAVLLDQLETRQDAENLKARVVGIAAATPVPTLPLADARITIIECADDPVISPDMRAAVRDRYAASAVHTLPRGGHSPYITMADDYNRIIGELLGG